MTPSRRDVLKMVGGSVLGAIPLPAHAHGNAGRARLQRDVCVLGGGSAGTHAALRSRDFGASVAVVERSFRLGGHAETYFDPASGVPINIGVIVFENVELVQKYFVRLHVNASLANFASPPPAFVDFTTGRVVDGYAPPDQAEAGAALFAYRQILQQNFPYLDDGFELPDSVPEDLARPFGDFIQKYNLGALFPNAFQFGQGVGDVLGNPALYVIKNFSAAVVDAILATGFLVVPSGVSTIYDAAAAELGDDVLYEAKLESVVRNGRGRFPIEVKLRTPTGEVLIACKKLVVAFPPTPRGFEPFDFHRSERELFDRLAPNHYFTGVVKLSGLPEFSSLQNTGAGTPYNLPSLPGLYGISPTGAPGLWNVKYASPSPMSSRAVQSAIVKDLRRVARAGTFPIEFEGFSIFKDHSPFEIMTTSRQVARGFHKRMNEIQGYRDTFYTGATFQTNDSSLIWRFNERLLPRVFA